MEIIRTIVIIIFLTLFLGCKNTENKKKYVNDFAESAIDSNHFNDCDSIISESLKLYLLDFINKVDSIPNPFDKSLIYSVIFTRNNNDTIVEISASIWIPKVLAEFKNKYERKGIVYLKSKVILFGDSINELGLNFYNVNSLKQDSISDNKEYYNTLPEPWTFVPPYIKLRVINGDSLKIVDQYGTDGRYDYYK